MFNCSIFIYCLQFIHNNIFFFSLDSKKFVAPKVLLNPVDDLSINDNILNILDDYIGSNSKYLKPIFLDVYKNKQDINLYYVCIMPLNTKLVNGYYLPYNILSLDPIAQKAIMYV